MKLPFEPALRSERTSVKGVELPGTEATKRLLYGLRLDVVLRKVVCKQVLGVVAQVHLVEEQRHHVCGGDLISCGQRNGPDGSHESTQSRAVHGNYPVHLVAVLGHHSACTIRLRCHRSAASWRRQ